MRWLRIGILSALAFAVVVLLGLVLFWPRLLRHFTYMGRPLALEHRAPDVWGYSGEEITFRSSDGVLLHGWWLPAPVPKNQRCGTLLFLHGNAGNLGSQAGLVADLTRYGLDVLVFDYRGYGASQGAATEEGIYRDAAAAYDYLHRARSVPSERILLLGHSLGSAVASELAVRRPAAGMILAAPFTSFPGVLQSWVPGFPTHLLSWENERFDALSDIESLSIPVLIATGTQDRLVPARSSRALFNAAAQPKTWVEVRGGHNSILQGQEFHDALPAYLRRTLGCTPPPDFPPS